eukprot:scaffold320892_cov21-Tisochrysis_lutea.AAC.1
MLELHALESSAGGVAEEADAALPKRGMCGTSFVGAGGSECVLCSPVSQHCGHTTGRWSQGGAPSSSQPPAD